MKDGSALLVRIELDKERHLRFDLNAIVALDEATGINLLAPGTELGADQLYKPRVLRAFVWAALLHEDPDLTVLEVGSWLTMPRIQEIATAVWQSIVQAMPEVDEVSQEAGNASSNRATRRRNGAISGKSPSTTSV